METDLSGDEEGRESRLDSGLALSRGQAGCNLHSAHLREQQEKKPLPPSRKPAVPCGREISPIRSGIPSLSVALEKLREEDKSNEWEMMTTYTVSTRVSASFANSNPPASLQTQTCDSVLLSTCPEAESTSSIESEVSVRSAAGRGSGPPLSSRFLRVPELTQTRFLFYLAGVDRPHFSVDVVLWVSANALLCSPLPAFGAVSGLPGVHMCIRTAPVFTSIDLRPRFVLWSASEFAYTFTPPQEKPDLDKLKFDDSRAGFDRKEGNERGGRHVVNVARPGIEPATTAMRSRASICGYKDKLIMGKPSPVFVCFQVGILYFHPSVFRCILLRWVRLLGFATVYGTLTLKLYRVLKVFLSRTAQRIPYMTSWRVLRLLAIILLIVCWFLVAWTSAVCQNPDRKLALIDVGHTPDGSQFGMCLLDRWDYMMAVAEFLFLLWAVYLCYAVRTVPSAFHEPRYMAIAVHNELVLSAIFHVIRFTLAHELHPDWMLLLFFTHTHLTVTVTLGLLLVPKFLFAGTHMRDDIASEAYEDELDMGRSGSYLNSSITSAWSEHSLDPEDIREELKKLYSQLEIYKRKKMLANNPHLQKKRSSKKGLGRSLMRRITEIPESVHRQCSREDKEVGDYGSNRNSICMLKKNPLDPSHQVKPAKEETLKDKVFSLKKSHSSYDHVRDQNEDANRAAADKMETATNEGSLLDTLMGKKLVKKKSSETINAPSESTESVPLVCKSASAHNLTADKKPIHPRASMLQKSLSVIASAKEKTLGLTGKAQSSEDSNKKSQPKSRDTKANTETENDCQPKMIISQSVDYKQSATKGTIMKQPVSGSQPAICSDPARGKDLYDVSEVCPWELEDLPTPSENKIQKHVSIAPTESTTIHGGSTKGSKSQKQKASDQSPSGGKHSKESQRMTSVRAEVCPWEEGGETQTSLSEGPRQQVSSQSRSNRPHSTLESSKTKRADICPWDYEEQQKVTELARSPDTIKQKKSSSPVDGRGRNPISDAPKGVTSLPLPTTKAEICPWDYDSAAVSPNTDRTPSPAQAPKAKESPTIRKGAPSTRTVEKEKLKDTEDEKSLTKSSDKRLSQQKLSEVCPWDAESPQEGLQVEKRKSANVGAAKPKQAEVCPWDFEDVSSKKGSDKSAPVEKQSNPNSKAAAASSAKKAEVCPWDFDESKSSKKA
ncbi:hypothetical protein CCH79_00003997 [Gambusia affinis]|uniref:G-protein coupled receptors family 3 profile domain-containing protein n=1 Tax=Gambusia affinis TaxID=33528 RepID=A0A315V645_GAMAF|nr:hypothetical protein CCH79_00003997 [Gambusia affinis]